MDSYGGSTPPRPASRQAVENALQGITGIGPGLSKKLAALGVDLAAIAEWNVDDIDRIDGQFKIKNHGAEGWPDQARELLEKQHAEQAPQTPPQRQTPHAAALKKIAARHKHGDTAQFQAEDDDYVPAAPRRLLRRLDRNRKVSEVHGTFPQAQGAAFVQDGIYFNQRGIEIVENPEDYDVEPEHELSHESMLKQLDLVGWAKHTRDYPFPMIRKVIRERYHRDIASSAGARAFILRGELPSAKM